jgi:hypothetical protein
MRVFWTLTVLFFAVGSGSIANASRARLAALGQSSSGSLFIEDTRNIFLNPAVLHKMKDQVVFETGGKDVASTPSAEGLMIHRLSEDRVMALALGSLNRSLDNNAFAITAGGLETFLPQNPLEVLYGWKTETGDIGVSLYYGTHSEDVYAGAGVPDKTASLLTLRGGLEKPEYGVFGQLDLLNTMDISNAGGAKDEYKGMFSLALGGKYNLSQEGAFVGGQLTMAQFNYTNDSAATGTGSVQGLTVDYFKTLKKWESGMVFASGGLNYSKRALTPNGGGAVVSLEDYSLPVVLGLESQLNSWLVARASLKQNVLIDSMDSANGASDKKTIHDADTTVLVGMGFQVGDLTIDGVLEGLVAADKLNSTQLLSQVSVIYPF